MIIDMQMKHLDGHEVTIRGTSIKKPGQVDVLKNEGMPLKDDVSMIKLDQLRLISHHSFNLTCIKFEYFDSYVKYLSASITLLLTRNKLRV